MSFWLFAQILEPIAQHQASRFRTQTFLQPARSSRETAVRSRGSEPQPLDPKPVHSHTFNRVQQFKSSLNNLRRASSANHNVANPSRRSISISIAVSAAILIIPGSRITWLQALLASQLSRAHRQTGQHKRAAHHRTTINQKFGKYLSPQVAIATTLEIALILSMLSCGAKTPPTPQPGTPANTYTLTLSASTPGGPPPTTQPLTLTIQ